jgi:membrane-bound lytic murein transglycosylase D
MRGIKPTFVCQIAAAVAILGLASPASSHGKITLQQAKEIEAQTPPSKTFPVVLNSDVVDELNRFIGTRVARQALRGVLERLDGYRTMIESKLSRHRLPVELLAIPLVESEYRAEATAFDGDGTAQAAGMWMIMRRTARFYGLKISRTIDERFNEEKATEAAARYLAHLYRLFHSWPLALVAYNRGETYVKERVAENGTRDAWKLDSADSDNHYLNKAMAAAFLLAHPRLLE